MVNAQKWLDKNYLQNGTCIREDDKENYGKRRDEITNLDISNQNLEGDLTLELKEFPNLEELNCSNNQITKVIFSEPRSKTRLAKKQKLEWKLKKINLTNNNFAVQDLSFLGEFFELEELLVGNDNLDKIQKDIYNRFVGSLEPLQNLTKLRKLDITGTDLDSGLEYLPTNLQEIHCLPGARITARTKVLTEPAIQLFAAVKENKMEAIGEIVRANKLTNINFYDEQGNSLLHYTTQKGDLPLLKLLVRNGGNVNAVDKHGWSVLHSAALWIVNNQGDWNIIEFLLENGADTNIETDGGSTARDLFFRKDYSYIEQYDNLAEKVKRQTEILIKK